MIITNQLYKLRRSGTTTNKQAYVAFTSKIRDALGLQEKELFMIILDPNEPFDKVKVEEAFNKFKDLVCAICDEGNRNGRKNKAEAHSGIGKGVLPFDFF